ncbi:MAG: hypothetical protein ATN35_07860 [Epulopiscium sp. Nele67-Bin004]|nr:MAG: hypothetical protein ATN35_07860 [Epulopiscium sp. Nele67-Bin004]
MGSKFKKYVACLGVATMSLLPISVQAMSITYDGKTYEYTLDEITLFHNGEQIETPVMPPIQLENTTLVPVNEVFSPLGAYVVWEHTEKTVYVYYHNTTVVLEANNSIAKVNGEEVELSMPVKIINDKVMVPLRFIAEQIGLTVHWNNDTRRIDIITSVSSQMPEPEVFEPERPEVFEPEHNEPPIKDDTKEPEEDIEITLDYILASIDGAKELYLADVDQRVPSDRFAIEAIIAGNDSISDYVIFKGLSPIQTDADLDYRYFTLEIDIEDGYVSENTHWDNMSTNYITGMSIRNRDDEVRVEIDLLQDRGYIYLIEPIYDSTIVRIYTEDEYVEEEEPEVEEDNKELDTENLMGTGVVYDATQNVIAFDYMTGQNITVTDNYRDYELIIDLGGNYSSKFNSGHISVSGDYINDIEIVNGTTTQIIISQNTIFTYNLSQLGERMFVELVKPQEKYDRVVMFDLGHGGSDPGATGNGLVEKDLVMTHAFATRALVEANTDIKVYMTRETDEYLYLTERTDLSNDIGVDLFVSFHANSFTTSVPNGVEVYYFPDANDTSGKQLAEYIVKRLVDETGLFDRGAKEQENYVVLKTSDATPILLEPAFLSNASDAALLKTDWFTEKYAQILCDAIVYYFDVLTK